MKTFEYKVMILSPAVIPEVAEKELNSYGAVGWELVSVSSDPYLRCIFKRKLWKEKEYD